MTARGAPAPPAPIERVLETCVYAVNLEEVERFYCDVLGLEPFSRAKGRHAFFRCGRGMLLVFNPEHTSIADSGVPAHGAHGPGHVAFAVSATQLDAWRSHLERIGVGIEAEVEWPRGGRSIYFRDPAGNCLELASPDIWNLPDI